MPYIGSSPSNGVRRVHTYTATASQTTFTGASSEGVTLSYADTNYIDVFQNGVLLGSADYTSTSGTSVVLTQACSADDLIVIIVYDVFSVADTVSKTNGGSFDSGVTMSSTLGVTGASTLTGALSAKGGAVFNEDSADVDFRVEGNGDAHALFVQGGSDHVGINNNSPNSSFTGADNLVIGGGSGNTGMTILSGASSSSSIEFSDGTSSDAEKTAGGIRYYHDSDYMRFNTGGGTERYRIDGSGNHRWQHSSGDPSAFSSGQIGFQLTTTGQSVFATTGNTGYVNRTNYSSGTIYYNIFLTSGSTVGSITYNGSATAYNTSSDYRLKESVTYDFDATSRLKQLKPSRFNFIGKSETVDGFLAHEVASIVPEAITGAKDGTEDIGTVQAEDGTVIHTDIPEDKFPLEENQTWTKTGTQPVYQQIDQAKLVPLLVKTIQELEARITALENAE